MQVFRHRRIVHTVAFMALAMFAFPLHICTACECGGACQLPGQAKAAEPCDTASPACPHCTKFKGEGCTTEGDDNSAIVSDTLQADCCSNSDGPCECCLGDRADDNAVVDSSHRTEQDLQPTNWIIADSFTWDPNQVGTLAGAKGTARPLVSVRLHSLLSVWLN